MKKQNESIKPGTIWQLGEHRLAYGDCRDTGLVERLIGKEKISLINLDPPYGVAAVESKRGLKALVKDKAITNDQLQSDEDYRVFSREWLTVIVPHLAKRNTAYIFNADKMVWSLREGMIDAEFRVSQLLVWVKSQAVMGRLDYAPQHELILYGWYGTHVFRRSKDKSVLFCPRPAKSPYHPTTKPLSLIRRLVLNSSEIGGAVYDGFLGSGTTLLACEQIKRRCFAVELDEEYCLTAIRRWEQMTGHKAQRHEENEQLQKILLDQLRKAPIVEAACQKAGISRMTFYRWKKEDAEFARAVEEAMTDGHGLVNDLAESQLIGAVKERNMPAISYWLRHHHPAYANTIQIKQAPPDETLNPEQEALVREALRLASASRPTVIPLTDEHDDSP